MEQKYLLAQIKPKTIKLDPETLRQKFEERYKTGYKNGSKRIIARLEELSIALQRALRHRNTKEFAMGIEMIFHGLIKVIEQEKIYLNDLDQKQCPKSEINKILNSLIGEKDAKEPICV